MTALEIISLVGAFLLGYVGGYVYQWRVDKAFFVAQARQIEQDRRGGRAAVKDNNGRSAPVSPLPMPHSNR